MSQLYHSPGNTASRTLPEDVEAKLRAARRYVERGWRVFVLGEGKTPVGNCVPCRPENAGPGHDRRACVADPAHLTCHAHYAATDDLDRVAEMLARRPYGWLAVATGVSSGIVVLDADTKPDAGVTGPEVLENWDTWTGGDVPVPPPTLRQNTGSGGLHLVYDAEGWMVPSRRVLPGLDVKAEGGYVAVGPGADGRRWVNWLTDPAPLPAALGEWLRARRPRGASGAYANHGVGGRAGFGALRREVELGRAAVPAGSRDTYARDLAYALRRADVPLREALETAGRHWQAFEQPGDDGGQTSYFPLAWVHHKVRRTYDMIEPEPVVGVGVARFIERANQEAKSNVVKRGGATITRRSR